LNGDVIEIAAGCGWQMGQKHWQVEMDYLSQNAGKLTL
jgi:hypothetical protein